VLENYLPILIFIIIGGLLGVVALIIGRLLGPKRPDPAKNSPYECGFPPFDDARLPFDVRFYLVAILFIIFDLETAFLVPWAVVFRELGWFGLAVMGIFLGLLVIGFIYEWKKGALEWD
jgi:NADH-quinone oxidoreductase subunit A